MKRVLFVEKVIEATGILPILSSNNGVFEIDSTSSLDEAVNLIRKNIYNIVYINIDFLDMSIIPLLEALMKKQFLGNIIFSGDYKNPRVIKKTDDYKSLDILIKPFDSLWLKNTILDHLKTGKSIGNEYTNILSLHFIFKIIDIEKGDIAFKINFDGKKGFIVLENGIVVHSKFNNKGEIEALTEILETQIPYNKKEIKIATPGLFVKKNSNISLSSILSTKASSVIDKTPKKNSSSNSYSELISFMIEKIESFCSKNGLKVIEKTIKEMGFSINSFPSSEEIDLIENVSRKFDDKSGTMKFKKCMINFLISKEKNC